MKTVSHLSTPAGKSDRSTAESEQVAAADERFPRQSKGSKNDRGLGGISF